MKKLELFILVGGILTVIAGVVASPIKWAIYLRTTHGVAFIGATMESVAKLYWMYFDRFIWLRAIGYLLIVTAVFVFLNDRKKKA